MLTLAQSPKGTDKRFHLENVVVVGLVRVQCEFVDDLCAERRITEPRFVVVGNVRFGCKSPSIRPLGACVNVVPRLNSGYGG